MRCVIAAGWAVGDSQASAFATTFYDALLDGDRFIDAVARARAAAYELGGNTWAAYQCYGDPDRRFRRGTGDAQRPTPLADEFAGVASAVDLVLALETLAIRSKSRGDGTEDEQRQSLPRLRDQLRHLEARFGDRWGDMGRVAEAFAVANTAARNVAAAIRWYERALTANDGGASLKAAEQLGNLRARLAFETAEQAKRDFEQGGKPAASPTAKAKRLPQSRKGVTGASRRKTTLDTALQTARTQIENAVSMLEDLATMQPTIERQSLCGSAWKRKAMLEALAGQQRAAAVATGKMHSHGTKRLRRWPATATIQSSSTRRSTAWRRRSS